MANILGTAGIDTLTGTLGDDVIDAGAGNDIINASQGNDTVDGGAGTDRLVFTLANAGLFTAAAGARAYSIGASSVTDTGGLLNTRYLNVENITFSTVGAGNFDDSINASGFNGTSLTVLLGDGNASFIGSIRNDSITTGRGDNVISTGDGTDTINASQGHDVIDGGSAGTAGDILAMNMAIAGRFDAATGARTYTITANHAGDSSATLNTDFTSIERFNLTTSNTGNFNDTVDASGIVSSSTGTVFTLFAGNGNDTITASNYADFVDAGRGSNWVDAGGGFDTVRFHYDSSAGGTLFITGSGNTLLSSYNGQTNSALNAEDVYVFNDNQTVGATIDASGYTGSARLVLINSNIGSDTFIGHNGADVFGTNPVAVTGGDTYTGNGGADLYDYLSSVAAMNGDRITDFDADDIIDLTFNTPASNSGTLAYQFVGNGAFTGSAGQYRYYAAGGETFLQVDSNGDTIADQTLTISNGSFVLKETVAGSNQLRLAGQVITGTNGIDTLTGTLGDDIINGLDSSDTINATQGADFVDGGNGNDRLTVIMGNAARFAAATGPRTYTITNTSATDSSGTLTTTMSSLERFTLDTRNTGNFGDTINLSGFSSGAPSAVNLFLGDGDDSVVGSAAADFIFVGFGQNVVDAGGGVDVIQFKFANTSGDTLYISGTGGTVVSTLNGVVTNTVTNGEEIDIFGADFIAAVTRVDASAFTPSSGVRLVFYDNNGSNIDLGSAGGDIFANVHGGEAGNDIYTGNGGADIFDYTYAIGAMDRDTITDLDSDDVIDFQYNTPTQNGGGLLANAFIGSAAFSNVAGQYRYYTSGAQTFVQVDTSGDGVADETLTIANGSFELVETSAGSQILKMGRAVINGTAVNDTLTGTLGDDIINGLADNDILNATQGRDLLDGGAGTTDRVVVNLGDATRFAAATGSRVYTITSARISDSSGTLDTNLAGVERMTFSTVGAGNFGDTINASGWQSTIGVQLRLGNGNDTVIGSSLTDNITSGLGVNTIDSGGGYDIVSLQHDSAAGTVFATMAGGALITSQNGVQVNSIVNGEEIHLMGIDANAAVTTIDASSVTGFTGQLIFWDNDGSNISIGGAGADIFANIHGYEAGNDVYTGNGGADVYDYTYAVSAMDRDRITDFDSDDIIDLTFNTPSQNGGGFLANAFIGSAAFSNVAGQYRYTTLGGQTLLQVDTSGDGVADETLTIANGSFELVETFAGSQVLKMGRPVINGTAVNEALTGTLGDEVLNGLGGNDTIQATKGRDFADGGIGFDTLNIVMSNAARFSPTTGSQTYLIDNDSAASSSGGLDTQFANIERIFLNTLGTGDHGDTIDASGFTSTYAGVNALRLFLGNGSDSVTGSAMSDYIDAGLGNNMVNAGGGFDEVHVSFVNSSGGTAFVTGTGGIVQISTHGIVSSIVSNAELVAVHGATVDAAETRINASGLSGFTGQLILWDNDGSNISIGSSGRDIFANIHNYVLGTDVYTGGGGADIYDYTYAVSAMDGDRITDFDSDDVIDLRYNSVSESAGGFLANAFIGTALFSGIAGQFRYEIVGSQTIVQVDTSGDRIADETLTIENGAFELVETSAGSNILKMAAPALAVGGMVADGYVAGATLFVDTNGNGRLDRGEAWTVTAADGSYALKVTGNAALVAIGGTNIDTGFANTMTLRAPTGSGVVNPLTTLIAAVIAETGLSSTAAAAKVGSALGLDAGLNLLTFDPLANPDSAAAIEAQKAAATIASMIANTEAFAGSDGAAESALLGSLAELVAGTIGTPIDLTSSATVSGLLNDALGASSTLAALTAEIVSENATIDNAVSLTAISDAQSAGLSSGNELANTLIGTDGANTLRGFGGDDVLKGLGGDDVLDGGSGADVLYGGAGNDIFLIDNNGDRAIEVSGEGYDTIRSSVSFTLGDNVERLELTGTAAINGTGNALDNFIIGNTMSNRLSGGDGNDMLRGGDGLDYLTGGAGADSFVIDFGTKIATKQGALSLDVIFDFGSGDRIDLGPIDSNASLLGDPQFNWRGTNANKAVGDLSYKVYDSVAGAESALGVDIDGFGGKSPYVGPVTIVFGNVDGGSPDFAIALIGVGSVGPDSFINL